MEMLESDDGRIQYRCQFTGYKKVTDARLVVERRNRDMEKGSGVNRGLGEEDSYIWCDREKEYNTWNTTHELKK